MKHSNVLDNAHTNFLPITCVSIFFSQVKKSFSAKVSKGNYLVSTRAQNKCVPRNLTKHKKEKVAKFRKRCALVPQEE